MTLEAHSAQTLPTPVALSIARLAAATLSSERIEHASDCGHAILKYVAILRLADWLRTPVAEREFALASPLGPLVWGASAIHWWEVSKALETATREPWLPSTHEWIRLDAQSLQALSRARKFRHDGGVPPQNAAFAAQLTDVVSRLLECAQPLLGLPLVQISSAGVQSLEGAVVPPEQRVKATLAVQTDSGQLDLAPWTLVLAESDVPGAVDKDLFVYERLTEQSVFFENDRVQIELAPRPRTLADLSTWVEATRRAMLSEVAMATLAASNAENVATLARQGLRAQLDREWRHSLLERSPARRPELTSQFVKLSDTGVAALLLEGASGTGKSFTLAQWLLGASRGGRVPIWLRAVSWRGEGILASLGQAAWGVPIPPLPAVVQELGARNGWAIAVDGINESANPAGLLEQLTAELRQLPGRVQLVLSSRESTTDTALKYLDPGWLADVTSLRPGVLEVGPLSETDAKVLWDSVVGGHWPTFDQLAPATRRLARLPLVAAMALETASLGVAMGSDMDSMFENYLDACTVDLERVLLRRLAATMLRYRTQGIDTVRLSGADSVLLDALAGRGRLGPAVTSLVDKGLILVEIDDLRHDTPAFLRFGHDRLLQWYLGRYVLQTRLSTHGETLATEVTDLSRDAGTVAHQPVLVAGIAMALAQKTRTDGAVVDQLVDSDRAEERAVGRAVLLAIGELAPERAREAWIRGWHRAPSDARRLELVQVSAEIGDPAILGLALLEAAHGEAVAAYLMRVRVSAPEWVDWVFLAAWNHVDRSPWLRLRQTIAFARALVQMRATEGRVGQRSEKIAALSRQLTTRLLGTGQSFAGKLTRRVAIELIAWAAQGVVRAVPHGPVDNVKELADFLDTSPASRSKFTPFIDLFAGTVAPETVRELAFAVATQHHVGPVLLLERAFIRAAMHEVHSAEALDLAVNWGRAAQAVSPPPMAAQSVLYVLASFLERTPRNAQWHERFAQFESLLEGWLAIAKDRRWSSSSQRRYKALFVTAHSFLLDRQGDSRPSRFALQLWEQAIGGNDETAALDLLDDLQILSMGRSAHRRALLECAPILAADWLPARVLTELTALFAHISAQDPDAAQEALAAGGPNCRRVAEALQSRPPVKDKGHGFYLDFDEVLLTSDGVSTQVAALMHQLLQAGSLREFVRQALEQTANGLTGLALFGKVK